MGKQRKYAEECHFNKGVVEKERVLVTLCKHTLKIQHQGRINAFRVSLGTTISPIMEILEVAIKLHDLWQMNCNLVGNQVALST